LIRLRHLLPACGEKGRKGTPPASGKKKGKGTPPASGEKRSRMRAASAERRERRRCSDLLDERRTGFIRAYLPVPHPMLAKKPPAPVARARVRGRRASPRAAGRARACAACRDPVN